MAEQEKAAGKQLAISKIYVKDFSFESPQSPAVFRGGDWKPRRFATQFLLSAVNLI